MDETDRLIEELRDLPAEVSLVDFRRRGFHLEVALAPGQVRKLAGILRDREFYLSFVSAVHVLPAIEVIYQYACFARPCRIMARAPVSEDGSMPTISDIFHGANWHERETRDMFGVVFSGHPYLQPLLLPEEDADLRPLLKVEGKALPREGIRTPVPAEAEEDNSPEKDGPGPPPGKER